MTAPWTAVLCDVDGVLRLWPRDTMPSLDLSLGLPEGTLAAIAFRPDRLGPAITGAVSDAAWRAGVARELGERCGDAARAREAVAAWSALVPPVDTALAALLREVDRHVPVLLASNATDRLEADLAAAGLAGVARGVVNSSRVGAAKPDPGFYRAALAALGPGADADRATYRGGRVLFVDDTPANVDAARAAGLDGVRYRTPDDLVPLLAQIAGRAPRAG